MPFMSASEESLNLLAKQYSQLQALETIIAEEKVVLQQHQPEELINISQQKNQLLVSIQTLDQQMRVNEKFAQDKAAGLVSQ